MTDNRKLRRNGEKGVLYIKRDVKKKGYGKEKRIRFRRRLCCIITGGEGALYEMRRRERTLARHTYMNP